MLSPVLPKKCEVCPKTFIPRTSFQRVCGRGCAAKVVKKDKREQLTARRKEQQSIPELIALADKDFCAYIRERDKQAGHLCISGGKPLDWSGNKVDAGHYRSRGAASHLRYNEDNCHAQSKYQNRELSGNIVQYRIGLIARIGLERVEALEADNCVHHWTKEELRAIRAEYKTKTKALKALAVDNP